MPEFEKLFIVSRGRPVEYNGRTIQLVDEVPLAESQSAVLTFRRPGLLAVLRKLFSDDAAPRYRQGVHLSVDKGHFVVGGQTAGKAIVLWEDTAPQQVDLEIVCKSGCCFIKNVWDTGDGTMNSWHNGAAMIVDVDGPTRRYRCNDGYADDDFDDIVFEFVLKP